MKKAFLPILIFSVLTQFAIAQNYAYNLVLNGDFEEYTELPDNTGEWDRCNNWSNVSGGETWPQGTPDYLHAGGTGDAQLPESTFGVVTPYSGFAVMGFVAKYPTEPEFREYVSTQFTSPFVIGVTYRVSFWITNGEESQLNGYACNHVGTLFSVNEPVQIEHEPMGGIPQYEIKGALWTEEWKHVTFAFIADSAYEYVTFGNLYDDENTDHVLHNENSAYDGAYYFLDKVEIYNQGISMVPMGIFSENGIIAAVVPKSWTEKQTLAELFSFVQLEGLVEKELHIV